MKKLIVPAFLLSSALIVAQCGVKKTAASTTPPATGLSLLDAAKAIDPNASQAMLDQGKEILNTNCTKCHGYKDPSNFTAEKWSHELDEMIPKAKLTEDQALVLRLYTAAYQKAGR